MFKAPCTPPPPARSLTRVPLHCVHPGPDQPRRSFPAESIERLADSIRLHGLLSPLLVRAESDGQYLLIAGERRLRALKLLNRQWAEAIVLPGGGRDLALIALVENLQREDLHYLDVAATCRRILDSQPITQEQLALGLSCSPSALANRLRLLKLPEPVQVAVRELALSERHARALLALRDEGAQLELARQAAEEKLSVKQLEGLIARRAARPKPRARLGPLLRDNRIVINALMDTVRQLRGIGVNVRSRVEEGEDCVNVIVTIAAARPEKSATQKGAFQA